MARKLRVELDVDAENAKRKVKNAMESASVSTGGGGGGGGGGPADEAAKSLKNLGSEAKETNVNMKSVAKAFTGIGVGLATSYAANHMNPGAGRVAVEYGASALTGASMGAMVGGPIGAAIGGLAGLLKTYFDKEGERAEMTKDFKKSEAIFASSRAQQKQFEALTDRFKGGGTTASLPKMREIKENFEKSAAKFVDEINEELKKADPDKEKIADLRRNLGYSRQMAERYERAIEDLTRKGDREFRSSTSATDALQKIGGMMAAPAAASAENHADPGTTGKTSGIGFSFTVPTQYYKTTRFGDPVGGFDGAMKAANEQIERLEKEGNELLKSIDEHIKAKEAGGTWQ